MPRCHSLRNPSLGKAFLSTCCQPTHPERGHHGQARQGSRWWQRAQGTGISAHIESEQEGDIESGEGHLLYPRLSGLQMATWPPVARTITSCTQGDHLGNAV